MFYNARFKDVLLVCKAEPFRYVTKSVVIEYVGRVCMCVPGLKLAWKGPSHSYWK